MSLTNWKNLPNTSTPVNETNLNNINSDLINVGTSIDSNYKTNIIKGKNIFNPEWNIGTKNGVEVTYSNGILTLNGTATSTTDIFWYGKFTMKANTPYTLSIIHESGTLNGTATFYAQNGEVWKGFNVGLANSNVIQTKDETYTNRDIILDANKFIRINSGASFDNYKIKFQIEKGLTNTSYENYNEPVIVINGDEIYNNSFIGNIQIIAVQQITLAVTGLASQANANVSASFSVVSSADNYYVIQKNNNWCIPTALNVDKSTGKVTAILLNPFNSTKDCNCVVYVVAVKKM